MKIIVMDLYEGNEEMVLFILERAIRIPENTNPSGSSFWPFLHAPITITVPLLLLLSCDVQHDVLFFPMISPLWIVLDNHR